MENTYIGRENAQTAQWLQTHSEPLPVLGVGNSMTPILKTKQICMVTPITDEMEIHKDDIVFVRVNGHYYLHKVWAVKNGRQYLIGNNHGHANGTVSRKAIFGKVTKIL